MTDEVAGGPPEPDDVGPVSYDIGPTQLQRLLKSATIPPALGLTAILISLASLTIVDPAAEIGDTYSEVHRTQTGLFAYRWEAGIRGGIAFIGILLAVFGTRLLLGRRPRITIPAEDLDAAPAALDAMEDAALAAAPTPPAWQAMVLGAGLLVSVVTFLLNVVTFAYAFSAHVPTQLQLVP